ncbi:DEAD/DEAH box helicase [Micromonospora rifamycinica]|nr:DEAD/DEAH box helicase [Micromonospora rifamycinica]
MRPTIAADTLRRTLTQYLTTTFGLTEDGVRQGLEGFLSHPEQGIFRGPYLRIRTPFRPAVGEWKACLDWAPAGFTPYLHQAKAFARLSTRGRTAEPTLITTGTGSGKTESFLIPVLDHCRRQKQQGRAGIKAILLYPMNALATDQTQRINELQLRDWGRPTDGSVAVCVPTREMAAEVIARLEADGLPVVEIGPDGPKQPDGVHVGTMHRFKGLEYQRMIIAGVADGSCPAR